MRLPKLAIENHQFTVILILLLVLFGVVSFITMPRSEDPAVSPASSSVIVVYPGANPLDLEELVIDPIEEVINELEDIKFLRSTAEDGLAVINVEFTSGSDPDDKYSDVVQKVNSIRTDLPEGIFRMEIYKWTVADVSILQLALLSESASYRLLEKEAERLENKLKRVAGVREVEKQAYPEQEVRVSVNLDKISQLKLSLNQVLGAIQSNNANIPGGNVDIGTQRFNIKTSGSYGSIDDIKNTIVDAKGGKIIYLKDIAEVDFNYEDKKYFARFNGERALFISVTQKEGTNVFDVVDGLKAEINKFKSELPEGIKLDTVFDVSESVSFRLNGFFSNLLQGLLLVGIVVFIAIGLRASIIVILAIPFSIMIGIGVLDLSGYGIEQMSIAGLVIALGLLVDNAIVVIENISRFMKLGHSKIDAAIKGTQQIAWAIVSSTATTVLAFVPIIMMQNITGDFIRSMPTTVVYTLSASLLISLMLTPYLSSKFIKIENINKESKFKSFSNKFIEGHYRRQLSLSLKYPKTVVAISIIVFMGSLMLFPLVGVSFFPKAEKPQMIININTPEGSSIDKTDEVAKYIENILSQKDEVKIYATNIGKGNPRIYYNIIPKNETATHAQIFLELRERDSDIFYSLLAELRDTASNFAGAKIEVKEFEQGPPVNAPIEIRVVGENLTELKRISKDVEKMFLETDGTININNPLGTSKTDLKININRAKAGMLGVPVVEIDRTVRAAMAGINVSNYKDKTGKEYGIVVRLPVEEKTKIEDFDRIYVSSMMGASIPLKQLASIEFEASPMKISHYYLERNSNITSDVQTGYSVDAVTNEIIKKLDNYNWPKGYKYNVAGELEKREESFGGMLQAIIIAVIGIFGVLVLQFRSYSQPLIVFSAIPLASDWFNCSIINYGLQLFIHRIYWFNKFSWDSCKQFYNSC
jgi:multidrug efflux pump subunit AcrB